MRYLLIRHGEKQSDLAGRGLRDATDANIGLTKAGFLQADGCGAHCAAYLKEITLGPVHVWMSSYRRAIETADRIASKITGSVIVRNPPDDRLNEIVNGEARKVAKEQWPRLFPGKMEEFEALTSVGKRFDFQYPGGESRSDASRRVGRFFSDLLNGYDPETTHVIVSHADTSRIAAKHLLHLSRQWHQDQEKPGNCSIRLIHGKVDYGYIYKEHQGNPHEAIDNRAANRAAIDRYAAARAAARLKLPAP